MEQAGKKRIFRSRQFWQAEIGKFRSGGQVMSDYCRDNGFALSTFTRKLKILGGENLVSSKSVKHKPSFIEVRTAAPSMLRLNLPSGISIEVPESYNPDHLAQVVAICNAGR